MKPWRAARERDGESARKLWSLRSRGDCNRLPIDREPVISIDIEVDVRRASRRFADVYCGDSETRRWRQVRLRDGDTSDRDRKQIAALQRLEMQPGPSLLVCTRPPSRHVFR